MSTRTSLPNPQRAAIQKLIFWLILVPLFAWRGFYG